MNVDPDLGQLEPGTEASDLGGLFSQRLVTLCLGKAWQRALNRPGQVPRWRFHLEEEGRVGTCVLRVR